MSSHCEPGRLLTIASFLFPPRPFKLPPESLSIYSSSWKVPQSLQFSTWLRHPFNPSPSLPLSTFSENLKTESQSFVTLPASYVRNRKDTITNTHPSYLQKVEVGPFKVILNEYIFIDSFFLLYITLISYLCVSSHTQETCIFLFAKRGCWYNHSWPIPSLECLFTWLLYVSKLDDLSAISCISIKW